MLTGAYGRTRCSCVRCGQAGPSCAVQKATEVARISIFLFRRSSKGAAPECRAACVQAHYLNDADGASHTDWNESMLPRSIPAHRTTCCDMLQHSTTCCNILQRRLTASMKHCAPRGPALAAAWHPLPPSEGSLPCRAIPHAACRAAVGDRLRRVLFTGLHCGDAVGAHCRDACMHALTACGFACGYQWALARTPLGAAARAGLHAQWGTRSTHTGPLPPGTPLGAAARAGRPAPSSRAGPRTCAAARCNMQTVGVGLSGNRP